MLKEQAKLLNLIAITIDLVALIAAFVFAFYLRTNENISLKSPLLRFYLWSLFALIPVWYYLLSHYGLYASHRVHSFKQIISSLVKVQFMGSIITAAVIYTFGPLFVSRRLYGYFVIISFIFLVIEKILLKFALHHIRKRGYNFRQILVVGTDKKAHEFVRLVEKNESWGLKIVGLLALPIEDGGPSTGDTQIIGRLDQLVDICKEKAVDEVVFSVPAEMLSNLEDYAQDLEEMGITTRMVLDFYELRQSKRELSLFNNEIPVITFYSVSFNVGHLFLKRCLDIIGACAGLCITGILFPFIAIAIKRDSPGPIFFSQTRIGESCRSFTCWKFRSMYIDAEQRKKELEPLNEMRGAIFKIKDDPRITPVGRFLRKTSLDEFPQFWNVLKGEMSLVGTRPPTPDEVVKYENWHCKRIRIKPGITGMWQVSGRNKISDFDKIAKLDIEYIEKWSLWLDLKILCKTIWVVFSRSGS
jgi:exopolysaccharide biosynthesis polyprenyl glycosylphosphotransferase